MSNVVLIMHRKPIAQGLIHRIAYSQDIGLIYEDGYDNVNLAIHSYHAKVALIEATELGPYNVDHCLKLCKDIRKENPQCKLLVMCSEQDEEGVKQVVDAKGKNQIDDFVFFDVTIDYLASKLISI